MDTSTLDEIGECFVSAQDQAAQDRCAEIADEEFQRLGRGTDRFVYALGNNRIVKFPAHDGKEEVNIGEAENYAHIKEDTYVENRLATVHEVHPEGNWLVMERADTPDYNSGAERPFDAEDLTKLGLAKGEWVCHDIRPSNFGKNEDGWKLIDYPHCHQTDDIVERAHAVGIY